MVPIPEDFAKCEVEDNSKEGWKGDCRGSEWEERKRREADGAVESKTEAKRKPQMIDLDWAPKLVNRLKSGCVQLFAHYDQHLYS